MTATAAFKPLRWSSVRDCSRKAVYEATNAPHRERSLREERWLYRGKNVGQAFVVALASEQRWKVFVASGPDFMLPYPHLRAETADEADAIAELQVAWELGTGHPDLFVKKTDTVIEVLSSQTASAEMIHSKLLQARGYARALDASSIALAIIDPATLEEERIIVTSTSPQWADLTAGCDERIAQVIHWRDSGEIPGRVCRKPGDAWGHFCLYAEHCFDGHQPDPVEAIASEEAQQLAIRLAHVKSKRSEISKSDKVLEEEQKEIEAELAEYVPAGEWQVGGYRVTRSPRSRSSFKLPLAEQDGRFHPDVLAEFTSTSTFEVWGVEKTGLAIVEADEEAPF